MTAPLALVTAPLALVTAPLALVTAPLALVTAPLALVTAPLALDRLDLGLVAALTAALVMPFVMLRLIPQPVRAATTGPVGSAEILFRMLAGVVLMLVLTGIARALGPRLSGLLTVFPIATTVLAVFSHRSQGAAFAAQLLRGFALGLYSLTAFFTTLALTLEAWGLVPAFGGAVVAALTAQIVVLNVQSQA